MRLTEYENRYIQKCNNFNTAIVDGKFPASGSFIDISKFTSFVFKVFVGTLNSALTCQVEGATAVDGTPADVTGAVAVIAADDDNEWVTIEVETANAGKQFVTLDVAGAAGGDDYLCIVFEGKQPRSAPVTQPAGYSQNINISG